MFVCCEVNSSCAWLGDTAMRFISVGVDTTAKYGTVIWYFPTCKLHTKA